MSWKGSRAGHKSWSFYIKHILDEQTFKTSPIYDQVSPAFPALVLSRKFSKLIVVRPKSHPNSRKFITSELHTPVYVTLDYRLSTPSDKGGDWKRKIIKLDKVNPGMNKSCILLHHEHGHHHLKSPYGYPPLHGEQSYTPIHQQ